LTRDRDFFPAPCRAAGRAVGHATPMRDRADAEGMEDIQDMPPVGVDPQRDVD
jgi:hypothetical protein